MAISNFGELQSAVAGWLDRDDLTAQIPDFIALGQARLRRELQGLKGVQTLVVEGRETALPANVNTVRSIAVSGEYPLQLVTPQRFALEEGRNRGPSKPEYAYLVSSSAGGGQLFVSPIPAQPTTLVLEFEERLVPFTTAGQTDSVLTNDPDLYLYSALVESAPYLKDDARIAVWEQRLQVALAAHKAAQDRRSYPNTPRMRPRRVLGR